jgi:hypothetical protein
MNELNVEVRGDLMFVIDAETSLYAIYSKPEGAPWMMARHVPDDHRFRARAWIAACGKARELGWIV